MITQREIASAPKLVASAINHGWIRLADPPKRRDYFRAYAAAHRGDLRNYRRHWMRAYRERQKEARLQNALSYLEREW